MDDTTKPHGAASQSDIAIIGMACRLPGADDPRAFWENLRAGTESVSFFSDAEMAANPAYRQRPNFVKAGAVLRGIDLFDAAFFGYSAREAETMDPQQRLFLECAWEAFEDAGYCPQSCPGAVGVYAGSGINTYFINNVHPRRGFFPNRTFLESLEDFQLMIGNERDFLTTRVSYKLNLRGPSINVQTACSTALTAVHLACQSLLLGECDMALAGSSTIRVPQETGYLYEEGMVASPDGHTRSFDAGANGTIFGSGVASVLLKRLSDAIADGDAVHAVIKGSAVNNDGAAKVGFTAPSVDGQAAVITDALALAEVDAETIGYVEAHGTGTALGDPVEIRALAEAFDTARRGFCALGSVKSNFGHLSWSAGMAGLLKTVLALKNRQIPPHLHFKHANPGLGLEHSPFYVNTELSTWDSAHGPLRAGVSAFGLGGSNAHVILEEAPPAAPMATEGERSWHVLALSAKSRPALRELVQKYVDYLGAGPQARLADLCYTTNVGRTRFQRHCAFAAPSHAMLKEKLLSYLGEEADDSAPGNRGGGKAGPPPLAFLFTGQGAHYHGMGRRLYETEPTFRSTLDECGAILRQYWQCSLTDLLFADETQAELLGDVAHAQGALFAFEYALARLWMSWGVVPTIVMGHSSGEYVAACIAGVFSLADGLKLSVMRGQLFDKLVANTGKMVTVDAPADLVAERIAPYLEHISIAALNGPLSTVVAGDGKTIDRLVELLAVEHIAVKPLTVARAGHSPLTEPLLAPLYSLFESVTLQLPRIPVVSNVSGSIAGDEIATPQYWCDHTRMAVQCDAGMQTMAAHGAEVFIEIGPDPVLVGMGAFCLFRRDALWLPSVRRPPQNELVEHDDWQSLAQSMAKLHERGYAIDWAAFEAGRSRRRVHLPTYPFQRQRHWIDAPNGSGGLEHGAAPACGAGTAPGTSSAWQDWLLRVRWEPREPEAGARPVGGLWLILADAGGLGLALADRLRLAGARCVLIPAESAPSPEDAPQPDHRGRFTQLFEEAREPVCGIVHLWGLNAENASELAAADEPLPGVWTACEGLLALLRAAAAQDRPVERIWVVTRAAQSVVGDDMLDGLVQAPLWALARVAGIEHPGTRPRCIDLAAHPAEMEAEQLFREVVRPSDDDAVALRGAVRYVARLTPLPRNDKACPPVSFRPAGAYMITGGLGGVGLLTAQWMIAHGARHLILLGRSAPGTGASHAIDALRKHGAQVTVLQADVSRSADLERAFDIVDRQSMPLLGIFHAAGVINDGVLDQQDRERFTAVLRPKVQGAWHLHCLAASRAPELEHFVLFSSAASLIGNAGQANHAAANGFMDALSYYRASRSLPALALNWGAWSEVGELVNNTRATSRLERMGFRAISSADGLAALGCALGLGHSRLGVAPMDWHNFLTESHLEHVGFYQRVRDVSVHATRQAVSWRARLTGKGLDQQRELLSGHVNAQACHVLGLSVGGQHAPLDAQRALAEYGMDSLSSIELRNRLQVSLQLALPATFLMQYRSIEAIIGQLVVLLADSDSPAPHMAQRADAGAAAAAITPSAARPLSMQQQRWLSLIAAGYGQRVVPIVFYTALDETAFSAALEQVVERNEILRYRFPHGEVEILDTQRVVPPAERLYVDLSELTPADRAVALGACVRHCHATMPDPAQRPSWDLRCLKFPDNKFLLLLSLQHLDFDGTSLSTFVEELRLAYRSAAQADTPLFSASGQYHEYVAAQRMYAMDAIRDDRAFFQGMYASLQRTTALPGHAGFDRVVPFESARYTAAPRPGLWRRVQDKAGALGVTPFSLLLASYARLIANITASSEPVIALIVNGRNDERFKRTIGPFTAPFPARVSVCSDDPGQLAMQCNHLVSEILARSSYPVSDLVRTIPAFKGFPIDSYFTDVGINFTNYRKDETSDEPQVRVLEVLGPIVDPEFASANVEELRRIPGLHLVIDIADAQLRLNFWYHAHRFSRDEVADWAQQYQTTLSHAVD